MVISMVAMGRKMNGAERLESWLMTKPPQNEAEQSEGTSPSLSPSAHACVGRDAGWQACRRTGLLRHLTCRSCLSGARSAKRVLRHTPHRRSEEHTSELQSPCNL